MIGSAPLFSLLRDGIPEVTVHGEIVVTHEGRPIFQTSDALGEYPARSLLKPFQYLATELATSVMPLRHVTALGSVSGTAEQVATIQSWFKGDAARFAEGVQLSPSVPLEERARVLAREKGQGTSQWYHTCFCKHAAIVEACGKHGWDSKSYLSAEHPFHRSLISKLEKWLGRAGRRHVVDGCGLPSPVFLSSELATLFEKLMAAGQGTHENHVALAMAAHPEWIGGPNRVDTRLMQKNSPTVIAKEGADGLTGIGAIARAKISGPVGIVVKIASGFYPELAALAVAPVLEALGLRPLHETPKGQTIEYHFTAFGGAHRKIFDLSPVLNEQIAVWPGDVPFTRDVSLDTNHGSHLTLSAIKTTLHVGTHTDGPNHFVAGEPGIADVDLEKYLGLCDVITVNTPRGATITLADLGGAAIRTKRVLLRTGTFPDPKNFNEDFVAPSPELIEHLGKIGVVLIGIDTPSMDPFSSKTLTAHKKTHEWKLGVIEGLVFPPGLEDGVYELSALPLRLENGDASPVRVALKVVR